ncbi:hypothetical protein BHM03_00035710 [Ensete ventricosum]|nr:hypothetical protein BHM03_00035710 [Ensete ventricosum]
MNIKHAPPVGQWWLVNCSQIHKAFKCLIIQLAELRELLYRCSSRPSAASSSSQRPKIAEPSQPRGFRLRRQTRRQSPAMRSRGKERQARGISTGKQQTRASIRQALLRAGGHHRRPISALWVSTLLVSGRPYDRWGVDLTCVRSVVRSLAPPILASDQLPASGRPHRRVSCPRARGRGNQVNNGREGEPGHKSLGFGREGELGHKSWDLAEKVNWGTNLGILAEKVEGGLGHKSWGFGREGELGHKSWDLAENVNSSTNLGSLAEKVDSGTNHGDLAERVNSGTNPEIWSRM